MSVVKVMDHTEYPKSLREVTEDSLRYIMKDAREAIAAWPDGLNSGYYADEIHYCAMELRRRRRYRIEVNAADRTPDSPVEYASTRRAARVVQLYVAEGVGLPPKAITVTKLW